MCLSIPGKIIEVQDEMAKVLISGNILDVNIQLMDEIKVDDYVLVHAGFALDKIDKAEAEYLLDLFENEG